MPDVSLDDVVNVWDPHGETFLLVPLSMFITQLQPEGWMIVSAETRKRGQGPPPNIPAAVIRPDPAQQSADELLREESEVGRVEYTRVTLDRGNGGTIVTAHDQTLRPVDTAWHRQAAITGISKSGEGVEFTIPAAAGGQVTLQIVYAAGGSKPSPRTMTLHYPDGEHPDRPVEFAETESFNSFSQVTVEAVPVSTSFDTRVQIVQADGDVGNVDFAEIGIDV